NVTYQYEAQVNIKKIKKKIKIKIKIWATKKNKTLFDLFPPAIVPSAKRFKSDSTASADHSLSSTTNNDSSSAASTDLTAQQKSRIEFQKLLAKARRNLSSCSDRVSYSKSKCISTPSTPTLSTGSRLSSWVRTRITVRVKPWVSLSLFLRVKVPSSLVNIIKELNKDLGCSIPSHGGGVGKRREGVGKGEARLPDFFFLIFLIFNFLIFMWAHINT
ncbi:LOW QUALITY PROTEIN: probable inactive uracil-DNA glycosylase, mitochondrial, partial [Malus domestica]|uniref:LOW QUALITY PROTEIN: probable inactive uracil-DNA glycosylase, mitochondrial n=1 Tax=Malus domestica TaxID=3750 RepID=UPI003976E047